MAIHLELEGESLAAVFHALTTQLTNDHVIISKHLENHSRLMSEVLGEPSNTPLDADHIISAIKTARDLNDILRESLQKSQQETERQTALADLRLSHIERLKNRMCSAVDKLGKKGMRRSAVQDFLMDAVKIS